MVMLILIMAFALITVEDAVSYLRAVVKANAVVPGRRKRLVSILVSMPASLLLVLICALINGKMTPEQAKSYSLWMETGFAAAYLGIALFGLIAAAHAARGELGKRAYARVSWVTVTALASAAIGATIALSLK
jgi:hypothetical protein